MPGFDIEEAAKIVAAAIEAVVEKAVEEEREASKLFTRQRSDLHKADIEYLKQAKQFQHGSDRSTSGDRASTG